MPKKLIMVDCWRGADDDEDAEDALLPLALLAGAGNASLMTPALRHTLCDHAAGNYRILTTMAAELLAAGASRVFNSMTELPALLA